jgi:hypothetical protein
MLKHFDKINQDFSIVVHRVDWCRHDTELLVATALEAYFELIL